jgi:hypothetical protein
MVELVGFVLSDEISQNQYLKATDRVAQTGFLQILWPAKGDPPLHRPNRRHVRDVRHAHYSSHI